MLTHGISKIKYALPSNCCPVKWRLLSFSLSSCLGSQTCLWCTVLGQPCHGKCPKAANPGSSFQAPSSMAENVGSPESPGFSQDSPVCQLPFHGTRSKAPINPSTAGSLDTLRVPRAFRLPAGILGTLTVGLLWSHGPWNPGIRDLHGTAPQQLTR